MSATELTDPRVGTRQAESTEPQPMADDEVLRRMIERDGSAIRAEAEAEAAVEREAEAARRAEQAIEADAVLAEARAAFKTLRDQRHKHLLRLVKLTADYVEAHNRYRAAQATARRYGVIEAEPVLDKVVETYNGTIEQRREIFAIRDTLKVGV